MPAKSPHAAGVSLFPFLAVMVCSMGALIFLLLISMRATREREVSAQTAVVAATVAAANLPVPAEEPAAPEEAVAALPAEIPAATPDSEISAATDVPLESPLTGQAPEASIETPTETAASLNNVAAEWQAKTVALREQRDAHARVVSQQKVLDESTRRRVDSLGGEIATLEAQLADLDRQAESLAELDGAVADRELLAQQLAHLKRRLANARQVRAGTSEFMVVPFDAASGTTRRPILIECTADGMRFIPEDVELRAADFEGFNEKYNPLLSGANALVNYWGEEFQKDPKPGVSPEPYILILVRPDGTVPYYAAMKMLSRMRQKFGYELIEATTPLHLPPVDHTAARLCRQAVERTLQERDKIYQGAEADRGDAAGAPVEPTRSGQVGGVGERGPLNQAGGVTRATGAATFPADAGRELPPEVEPFPSAPAGGRSWEKVDRFGGQQNRPRGPAGQSAKSGGPTPEEDPLLADSPKLNEKDAEFVKVLDGNKENTPLQDITRDDIAPPDEPTGRPLSRMGGPGGSRGSHRIPLENLQRRKWGLHAPTATIGMEKDVRIVAERDQLIIDNKYRLPLGQGETRAEVIQMVLVAIDERARSWGQAHEGFYWVPRIKFMIGEGGVVHVEQLAPSLQKAGLNVSREFLPAPGARAGTPAKGGPR